MYATVITESHKYVYYWLPTLRVYLSLYDSIIQDGKITIAGETQTKKYFYLKFYIHNCRHRKTVLLFHLNEIKKQDSVPRAKHKR